MSLLSPQKAAERLGVKASTVIAWIRTGQLDGMDMSRQPGVGKPRFKVSEAALIAFQEKRRVVPPAKTIRRRRQIKGVIQFFK